MNINFVFVAYALLDAAGRYDIKDLKVHTGRCEYFFYKTPFSDNK
jgi:hypothetical protein